MAGSESLLTHFAPSGGEHPVEPAGCADQLLRTPAEPADIVAARMCSGPIIDRVQSTRIPKFDGDCSAHNGFFCSSN